MDSLLLDTLGWQNQMIGASHMQECALRWAVAHKQQLSPDLIESFCATLEAHVAVLRASGPSVREVA